MLVKTLDVYLHRKLAGKLTQEVHGNIAFVYESTWLNEPRSLPLSQSLPLRETGFKRNECEGFFGGILPDGDIREVIAKTLGVSAKNDYSMLELIGGECAGAVTFIPSDERLQDDEAQYLPLTDQALADALRQLPSRPLLANGTDIRISLAGAQSKMAVHIAGDHISIPLGGAASTHIIKPENPRLDGGVYNEVLCMKLARKIGLPTAKTELGTVDEIDYLLVKRYDRIIAPDRSLQRLHQEDFCQAMGILSKNKYQFEGGPTLSQCFTLIKDVSSVPVIDIQALLDGAIFNFLIGNNDAHGKNYSILYHGEYVSELETRLAPFYDLLCTTYYSELSPRMAMKLGGEYESDKVYPRHFERLAAEAGLSKPLVLRRVIELAQTIISALPAVTSDNPVSLGVADLIRSRCERTLSRFRA